MPQETALPDLIPEKQALSEGGYSDHDDRSKGKGEDDDEELVVGQKCMCLGEISNIQ